MEYAVSTCETSSVSGLLLLLCMQRDVMKQQELVNSAAVEGICHLSYGPVSCYSSTCH
jgi:hypothetical protein